MCLDMYPSVHPHPHTHREPLPHPSVCLCLCFKDPCASVSNLVSQGSFQPFSVYTNPSSDSNNPAPVILICINPVSVGVFVQSAQFPGHSFSLPSLPPPSLESLAGATRVGAPALPAPEPGTIFSMQGGAGGEDGKGRTAFVFLVTFLFAESAVCQLECAG